MQDSAPHPDLTEARRPWYREPWPWVLMALPVAAVVGCMISLWLALAHPDFLVVDETEYSEIQSAIKAERQTIETPATDPRVTAPPGTAAQQAPGNALDSTHALGTDRR